jgi:transposase, IS5 family
MVQNKSRGLFDEQFRLDKISSQSDPLVRLRDHIDFEIFRKPLENYFSKGKDAGKGGRPAFDYVLMFKILVLQRYYNLSDDSTEYAILDRLSFMRFLGITISDRVPDAKTIWNFKNELAKSRVVEKLFGVLDKSLTEKKVILKKGKMIDASIVEAPTPHNTKQENEQLKEGVIPKSWERNPHKLNQKDTDGKWVTQYGKSYYGYKNHIKADQHSKIITDYKVTSANVHDSEVIRELVTHKDRGQKVYADGAYRSAAIEQDLAKKGVKSMIHQKGYRHKLLTQKERKRNKSKSRIRARIEHIFGFMENSMKGMFIRCRNLVRAQAAIGLMNLTYNLFRVTQLKVKLRTT